MDTYKWTFCHAKSEGRALASSWREDNVLFLHSALTFDLIVASLRVYDVLESSN